jgi:hypothetical protein
VPPGPVALDDPRLDLTVLRMSDVASSTGQRRYAEFITEYSPDV